MTLAPNAEIKLSMKAAVLSVANAGGVHAKMVSTLEIILLACNVIIWLLSVKNLQKSKKLTESLVALIFRVENCVRKQD